MYFFSKNIKFGLDNIFYYIKLKIKDQEYQDNLMINKEKLKNTCLLNNGKNQCRYLSKIEGEEEYCCLKHTENKKIIDNMIKEIKFKKSYLPIGDNCPGLVT